MPLGVYPNPHQRRLSTYYVKMSKAVAVPETVYEEVEEEHEESKETDEEREEREAREAHEEERTEFYLRCEYEDGYWDNIYGVDDDDYRDYSAEEYEKEYEEEYEEPADEAPTEEDDVSASENDE